MDLLLRLGDHVPVVVADVLRRGARAPAAHHDVPAELGGRPEKWIRTMNLDHGLWIRIMNQDHESGSWIKNQDHESGP